MRWRRIVAPVALCAMVLGGAGVSAASTSGQAGPVACSVTEEYTYSPGMSLVPQRTGIRGKQVYSCHGDGRAPVPVEGSVEGVALAGCLAVSAPRGREFLRYSDGGKSVVLYDRSSSVRVAGVMVVVLLGRVVEGRGKGAEVHRSVQMLPRQLPTACLTPEGLQRAGGRGLLLITPT